MIFMDTLIIAAATLIVALVTAQLMTRAVPTLLGTWTAMLIGATAWLTANVGMAVL